MKNSIKIVLLLMLVVLAGLVRENIFVRIEQHQAFVKGVSYYEPSPHRLYAFLGKLSYTQLNWCRYIFTLLFTLVFYGLTWLLVRWFFNIPANFKMIGITFALVLAFAALMFGLGYLTGLRAECYRIARYAMGLIETPLVVVLLFPVLWINHKTARMQP